mgnify:CR=1 FL=1
MKEEEIKMNPKIKKLKSEREKNCEKISRLTGRNEEIDQEIGRLENLDIIGLVRGVGLSPDQLAALLQGIRPQPSGESVEEAQTAQYEQEGGGYGEG